MDPSIFIAKARRDGFIPEGSVLCSGVCPGDLHGRQSRFVTALFAETLSIWIEEERNRMKGSIMFIARSELIGIFD